MDDIEEVVLAAQGLKEVTTRIKELIEFAHRGGSVSLTEAQAASVRDAFACLICRGQLLTIWSLSILPPPF